MSNVEAVSPELSRCLVMHFFRFLDIQERPKCKFPKCLGAIDSGGYCFEHLRQKRTGEKMRALKARGRNGLA